MGPLPPEMHEFELELSAGYHDFVLVAYGEARAVGSVVRADMSAVFLCALIPVQCRLEDGICKDGFHLSEVFEAVVGAGYEG